MSQRPWYQDLFSDVYLRAWAPLFSPERTAQQVEGIIKLLNLPSGSSILDLACGYGRIAIPLAQHGYRVTGLDLSKQLLDRGKSDTSAAGVQIRFIHSDMREIPFEDEFDAVINIFTSFGYLETEHEDLKVLREVHKALKSGGLFLLDFISREWVMRQYRPHMIDRLPDGAVALHEGQFDFLTSRNNVKVTIIEPDGQRQESSHSVRMYTLTELVKLLDAAELSLVSYYGGLDGSNLTFESRRTVVLSRK